MNEQQEPPISQNFFSSIHYFTKNSMIEMKRRTCYYLLALISVIVVSCAAQIAQTLTDKAQVIYLQVAEQQYGQVDITVLPKISYIKSIYNQYAYLLSNKFNKKQLNYQIQFNDYILFLNPLSFQIVHDNTNGKQEIPKALFNYTQIQESLKQVDLHNYISARNTFNTEIAIANEKNNCQIQNDTMIREYSRIYSKCHERNRQNNLIFIDTKNERQNDIGRLYKEQEIPKDQVVISQEIANQLSKLTSQIHLYSFIKIYKLIDIQEGETMIIRFDVCLYLFYLIDNFCSQPEYFKSSVCMNQFGKLKSQSYELYLGVKVYKIINDNQGKTSYEQSKTTMIMERKYLIETFYQYAIEQLSPFLQVIYSNRPSSK